MLDRGVVVDGHLETSVLGLFAAGVPARPIDHDPSERGKG
jgi:hypothetical protein